MSISHDERRSIVILTEFIELHRLAEIPKGLTPSKHIDLQGWNSEHRVFGQLIQEIRPTSIIEVGSWKGASAVFMARIARSLGLDCRILCIDTWLGGSLTYTHLEFQDQLLPVGGRLPLLEQFLTNVRDFPEITAMPSTTGDAAAALRRAGVQADLVYIDAGHEERAVRDDLESYWPLVRPGGILFGDDYSAAAWPGVAIAANRFAQEIGCPIQDRDEKYVLRKPASATTTAMLE
jgi:predicted O-methyltransferase YrrM